FLKELVSFLVHGSSVRVHLEIPEGIPPLRMDSSHFAQMIQNLILNALEAMPQGGDIFIQAEYQDGEVVLVIRDTGPGIPREVQSRIFEPGLTTKPAGTGLGLAVVKSVVERYGGEIEVFSFPGEGTTFRIRLPAAEKSGEKEIPSPETPIESRKFSGRVLVMDDEEPIRLLLAEALGYLGVEVETAENGPEALAKYEKALSEGRPFDLLLLDLTVPGGKGARWVAERLKDRQPRPRLILSTGYSLEGSEAIEPFDGLLRKPYTLEELTELLRRHLRS
uniref:ATP-binding protein n=1 Tax=Thermosulfurimonas sp. TaxID=2080236 RepID=UPI0025F445D2